MARGGAVAALSVLSLTAIVLAAGCRPAAGGSAPNGGDIARPTRPVVADPGGEAAADAPEASASDRGVDPVAPAVDTAAVVEDAATATPRWPVLTRLTEPGCCPLPFWSADSQTVLFWHAPAGGESGVHGVPVTGGSPRFVTDWPEGVHGSGAFTSRREGDETVLVRTGDGAEWRFETRGQGVIVSPDGRWAAWARDLGRFVPGQRPPRQEHFSADLDTGEVRRVEVPDEYALSDWTAEGAWLLSRRDRDPDTPALVRFDPEGGDMRPLLDGERLRTGRISPGGRWMAIMRTFEEVAGDNGLYVVAADGGAPPRRVELFGGYRWRDGERLLIVPQEVTSSRASMAVWQLEAASGQLRRLTDPDRVPFRIAAGEWAVSPDGARVVFRSADDDAIWVIALGD